MYSIYILYTCLLYILVDLSKLWHTYLDTTYTYPHNALCRMQRIQKWLKVLTCNGTECRVCMHKNNLAIYVCMYVCIYPPSHPCIHPSIHPSIHSPVIYVCTTQSSMHPSINSSNPFTSHICMHHPVIHASIHQFIQSIHQSYMYAHISHISKYTIYINILNIYIYNIYII